MLPEKSADIVRILLSHHLESICLADRVLEEGGGLRVFARVLVCQSRPMRQILRSTHLQLLDLVRWNSHQLLGNFVERCHPDGTGVVHQVDLEDIPICQLEF